MFEWLLKYILKMEEWHMKQTEITSNLDLNINVKPEGFLMNPTKSMVKQFVAEQNSLEAVVRMLISADYF